VFPENCPPAGNRPFLLSSLIVPVAYLRSFRPPYLPHPSVPPTYSFFSAPGRVIVETAQAIAAFEPSNRFVAIFLSIWFHGQFPLSGDTLPLYPLIYIFHLADRPTSEDCQSKHRREDSPM